MYDVTLLKLAPDARSAGDSFKAIERSGLGDAGLRELLRSFAAIDAVENAVAAPEIRVKVRDEQYLIRTGENRLMLYDAAHQDRPALVLALDEVMAELDGSAREARGVAVARDHAAAELEPAPSTTVPAAAASKPRLLVLGGAAVLLAGAILLLRMPAGEGPGPVPFHPATAAESARLQSAFAGVYLTGNEPGQHGIVFNAAGGLKLFELCALSAPRVIPASGAWGRAGSQPAFATDQPGGLIVAPGPQTLVYCGELYRRVP